MQITELQPKPQTLNFNGHEFTMILINGEPYFNANEVANTLEFANPRDAVANHVDSDDVALADTLTKGGVQKQKFINESGLYALIFASKKPSAKDFKKWVTKEVIPSIRKTGSYSIQPQISLPNFTDPAEAAIAWANEYKAKQALAIELKAAEPKINFYDKVGDSNNLLIASKIGQSFKTNPMSAVTLNKHLEKLDVYNMAIKSGRVFKQWFVDKGLGRMVQNDNGYPQAKFTTDGQQWITEMFTNEGII